MGLAQEAVHVAAVLQLQRAQAQRGGNQRQKRAHRSLRHGPHFHIHARATLGHALQPDDVTQLDAMLGDMQTLLGKVR